MSDERRRERRVDTIIFICTFAAIPLAFWATGKLTWEVSEASYDTTVDRPDCANFEFDRDVWINGDPDDRAKQAQGISGCRAFIDFRRDTVRVLLGDPAEIFSNGHRWRWEIRQEDDDLGPRELTINLKDGVVRSAGFFQPGPYGEPLD